MFLESLPEYLRGTWGLSECPFTNIGIPVLDDNDDDGVNVREVSNHLIVDLLHFLEELA